MERIRQGIHQHIQFSWLIYWFSVNIERYVNSLGGNQNHNGRNPLEHGEGGGDDYHGHREDS
jgi:hypothetical protein